jgi:molybdopterin-guanine dinucleotide biosynthesis protein A
MPDSISVAILAGGQSSRMGTDKAFVRVGGRAIVERTVERLHSLSDELIIVSNTPTSYAYLGLPVFTDLLPHNGPLGGLYTAVSQTRGEATLVVSCDQPFLNTALLRFLLDLRHGYDVVVPLNRESYPQSMHAVYAKSCLVPIRRCLDANRLKVIGFYPDVRVRSVAGEEIDRFDPQRLSFFNVNTPDDFAEAERLAASMDEQSAKG